MSDNRPVNEEHDPAAVAASRKKFLTVISIFVVPLILAIIWLQVVKAGDGQWGNTSRGELITPAVPLTEFNVVEEGSEAGFNLDAVRGHWTILYVPENPCDSVCEETLLHIRQLRLALNEKMERVERAVVVSAPEELSDELRAEQAGLRILLNDSAEANGLLAQITKAQSAMEAKAGLVYIVDPLGNLMMRYTSDLLPKALFKDLKHLLKVSRIG